MSEQCDCDNCKSGLNEIEIPETHYLEWVALGFLVIGGFIMWMALLKYEEYDSLENHYYIAQIAMLGGAFWTLAAGSYVAATFKVQNKEYKKTQERFVKERFEQDFFALLELHHRIVEGITMWSGKRGEYFSGRRCFADMYRKFSELGLLAKNDPEFHTHGFVIALYDVFFAEYHSYLGHYFRHLYHMVRFIKDDKDADDKLKLRLAKILRAQLSSDEQLLLLYNGLSRFGRNRFKPLIEEYSLLEQIDYSQLLTIRHLWKYKKTAWRDKDRNTSKPPYVKPLDLKLKQRKVMFDVLKMDTGRSKLKGVDLRDIFQKWATLGNTIYELLEAEGGELYIDAAGAFMERLRLWSKAHVKSISAYDDLNKSTNPQTFLDAVSEPFEAGDSGIKLHRIQSAMAHRTLALDTLIKRIK